MKNLLLIFSLILCFNPVFSSNQLDSLLQKLEENMKRRTIYDTTKEVRITNLKKLLEEPNATLENKYFILSKIISEYEKYSFDNALLYIERSIEIAKKLNDTSLVKESKLKLSKLLVTSGRYKEAIDVLNEIQRSQLPENLLNLYYLNLKESYSGLNFYSTVKTNKEDYSKLYAVYQDSLLQRLSPNSDESLALVEKGYRDERNINKALEINSKRLSQVDMATPQYSQITFERALLYELDKNTQEQKKFLTLSAISDIQASVKDNASLTELAMIFFKEGDIERAHKYIDFSVEDAEFYNSRLRYTNISNKLSVISKAYEAKSFEQKTELKKLLIFISVLVLFLLVTIIYIYRQIKRLSAARKDLKNANNKLQDLNEQLSLSNEDLSRLYNELSDSDRVKEQYIGTFLNLYSDYINKLDTYRKMVRKYIVSNKTNALLELTKSKQLIENELNIFYENFDKSFLHIYPDFVEKLNTLLKDEEKLIVKDEQALNTELRIFALIRLGITNSSKISKILRYSVNTIYNYRVKVKNSAKDRNTFEDSVRKIS
ncbi:transcriptional regulator [Hyunsoonleella jejuensis]|uniref:Transcriptional regulator n=2 Tax=Hyunsoonleella jejuensis TaxID=419940 RepID=A0A1H9L3K3_9FLAO|nr:transcriptional regulator [Hyunsoonleella jejuensis]